MSIRVGLSESYVYQTFDTRYHDDLGADAVTLLTFGEVSADHAFRARHYRGRGWRVHGHPLVYMRQGFDGGVSSKTLLKRVVPYCDSVGKYCQGIDVVNEPLHEPCEVAPQLYRETRRSCAAELCANEYDIHWLSPKLRDLCDWVGRVDVDRIGIQLHAMVPPGQMPSIESLRVALDRLAATGTKLWFSEVSVPSIGDGWTEGLQASWIEKLFRVAVEHPAVDGFTYWDVFDKGAWNPYSGLVARSGKPKPAYYALRNLIRGQWPWWKRFFWR